MLFLPQERLLAFRYLGGQREGGSNSVIAIFSLIGIMLGVATLIVVMSVMNGFRNEIVKSILGVDGHISVIKLDSPLNDYIDLEKQLATVANVENVTPVIESQVMASANGQSSGAVVRGMTKEGIMARKLMRESLSEKSLDEMVRNKGVVIGTHLADKLGLMVGDYIKLTSAKGSPTAFGTVPRSRAYPITGIFKIGNYEYDNAFIFMSLETAQTFFLLENTVNRLEVLINDPEMADKVATNITKTSATPLLTKTWIELRGSLTSSLKVERNVMFLILSMVILIAAFNIFSSLVMLVQSKIKDIGILRAMGARRSSIMRIFLLSGMSVGILGTLFGIIIGIPFAYYIESIRKWIESLTGSDLFQENIYILSHLPSDVRLSDITVIALMSLTLSLLATIYPSWRAAKLNPVEALRNE